MIQRRHVLLAPILAILPKVSLAAPNVALVAVAANFARVAGLLQTEFEKQSGYRVQLSAGSTGQLYAQITNGAPYDMLLAADQARPEFLEQSGIALARITYARGLLALWSARAEPVNESALQSGQFEHLAIANPALAPYGVAAKQALISLGLWENLKSKIVMGQNVGQAYALVASGNAALGLVAQSYVVGQGWQVPSQLYTPILQDAVLLTQNPAAEAFLDFLKNPTSQNIILAQGYGEVGNDLS